MKKNQKLSFGILDFGYRSKKLNSLSVIEDVIEYASAADTLGFNRFWISEHHDPNAVLAWSNPQPMVAILAGVTKRIKIGAAGVLMSIHNPYHIATYFKLLANLFPGRIDLGIARSVVNPYAIQCVTRREDIGNEEVLSKVPEKINYLLHYLRDEEELFKGGAGLVIPPYKGDIPNLWMLGSSYKSLDKALEFGVNFSRSIFHPGADPLARKEELTEFREGYFQKYKKYPNINLVISGTCTKTTRQAKKIIENQKLKADNHLVACANEFFDKINSYKEDFGVDEIILKNPAHQLKDRIDGLELVSSLFKLNDN